MRTSTSRSAVRAWFPAQSEPSTSYQSGGLPTLGTSYSGGGGVGMGGMGSATSGNEEEGTINQWETRFGMRVDLLAAAAYLLGPISGKYI